MNKFPLRNYEIGLIPGEYASGIKATHYLIESNFISFYAGDQIVASLRTSSVIKITSNIVE